MKSIKQVEITNFQSHANTVVEFAPTGHLTVITGNSDSGKTAVIRALRWVFYNQPQGTDFIRVGCTSSQVTVAMDDGWSVTRLRTPSKNQYIVTHPDGDKQVYEGFGNNVPVEVQQVLGVAPVDVEGMDLKLNIAEQLDGPFLGNNIAASFRAKVLGKLAGTEDVDVANKQLGTDLYRHDQDLKSVKNQLEAKTEQIEELAWVEGLGVKIAQLEVLAQMIKSKQEQLRDLKGLKSKADEVLSRISRGKEYLARYQGLDGAIESLDSAITTSEQWIKYNAFMQKRRSLMDGLQIYRDRLAILSEVEEAQRRVVEAEASLHKLESLKSASKKQEAAIVLVGDYRKRVQSLVGVDEAAGLLFDSQAHVTKNLRLKHLKSRYDSVTKDHREAQEACQSLRGAELATKVVVDATEALAKLNSLQQTKVTLSGLQQVRQKTLGSLELAKETREKASRLYAEALAEAGVCPTCGAEAHVFKLKEVI